MKYKITKKIKQITPMIHFQPDQKGATLRATELKPKLDRFIVKLTTVCEQLLVQSDFNNQIDAIHAIAKKDKEYFLRNDNPDVNALNYKVRVKVVGESKRVQMPVREPADSRKGYGAFFPIDDKIKDSSFYDYIEIDFISFNTNLLELIGSVLPTFFATTNFGFRQNKGFGHFIIESTELEQLSRVKKYYELFPEEYKVYQVNKEVKVEYKEILELIYKLNEKVKDAMEYRRECKKGKQNNSSLKQIQLCCENKIGRTNKDMLLEVLPEAELYVKNKKSSQRISSFQQLADLVNGTTDGNYKIMLNGVKDKIYEVELLYCNISWKAQLEDRNESPMYFIPVWSGENLLFDKVIVALNCDRLNDIQKELLVDLKFTLRELGTKTIYKEVSKSVAVEKYDGLLEEIFKNILCKQRISNTQIVNI